MRLDFKTDASMLMTEVSRMLGLAPILTMMIAVLMLVLAIFSVQDLLVETQKEKKSMELPAFTLKKLPVGKKVYEDYSVVLGRLSPHVTVAAEKDGLRIDITDPARYAEFMYVLNSVQGVSKDVVWKAKEICLAGCAGKASTALVTGIVEKVEVKLRGQENE
ncbi:hypothetical protein [Limnobacter parvus]|uniref:Uncharacterized protein n=1 Tax=Limnobacter parvus TaxID=2939690 RepID=A0ABT1XCQ5_9BURK|nr:hypothetical protein [Limnobacter parvus]MCR2745071.1 hypothetical protein [Limnobacter parvus]